MWCWLLGHRLELVEHRHGGRGYICSRWRCDFFHKAPWLGDWRTQ